MYEQQAVPADVVTAFPSSAAELAGYACQRPEDGAGVRETVTLSARQSENAFCNGGTEEPLREGVPVGSGDGPAGEGTEEAIAREYPSIREIE